jgi:DNA-binding transcriptional ArsR family regulator
MSPPVTRDRGEIDRLNLIFGALADPTRRAILGALRAGDASVTDLTRPFDLTMPAISDT